MSTEGSASGADAPGSREKTTAKAILISIVAAVGGFLFGFDSSVINGAVDALNDQFGLQDSPLLSGFAVACALLGSAAGAWFAGPAADRYGRVRVMLIAAGAVRDQLHRVRPGVRRLGPHHLAHPRRRRHRHRLGDRPRLHRRDRARPHPRAARVAAADGHRARHLRRPALRRPARGRRRRRRRDVLAGPPGVALDVPRRRHPVGDLRSPRPAHPRVAALPRGQGAHGGGRPGPRAGAGTVGRVGPGQGPRDRRDAASARRSPACATCAVTRRACARSSGSASCCRSSSSSSAST